MPHEEQEKERDDKDIVFEATERFETAEDAEQILRDQAIEDLKFCYEPGAQWEESVKSERENRPCYEYNKIKPVVRQIVNELRQNRPGIKFRGVDSEADPKTAEVMTGLARNIYNLSDGDTVIDTAFQHAVVGGYGVFGIITEFSDDTGFEQDIRFRRFDNPFLVTFDPNAESFLRKDARYAFVSTVIPKDEFEERYPDATVVNWEEAEGTHMEGWFTENNVRVAEYWRKVPTKKEIALLDDGRIVEVTDETREELLPVIRRNRVVDSEKVEMYLVTGNEVLEGPFEWPGRHIPLIPVFGETVNIEGELHYSGIVRDAKDAQRSYNYHKTTLVETAALQPKAPYIATVGQIKGYEKIWQTANKKNYGVLPYNPDAEAPGPPARQTPPQVPQGLMELVEHDNRDIRETTSSSQTNLGQDERDRIAFKTLRAQQSKGEIATFAFRDNLAKAMKFAGEILVDLIPKIYDTQRQVRILGEDGQEDFVPINTQTPDGDLIHDLQRGKYDVVVTTGPSHETKRQEVVDWLLEFFRVSPDMAPMLSDILLANMDMPEASEARKRVRLQQIRQGLVQPDPQDEDERSIIEQQAQQAQKAQVMEQLQLQGIQADIREKVAEAMGKEADVFKRRGEAEEAGLLAEEKFMEIQGQRLENVAKSLDNLIKEGQIEAIVDPRTNQIRLVSVGKPDLNPQLNISTS